MRMCGHAHHDDMLYLGTEPQRRPGTTPRPPRRDTRTAEAFAYWARTRPDRDLRGDGCEADGHSRGGRTRAVQARRPKNWSKPRPARSSTRPGPTPAEAGAGVFADEAPRRHVEPLEDRVPVRGDAIPAGPALEPGPPFDPQGRTFLEAVMLGVGDALRGDERVFVYGQDVGGKYGNAFLLLRPLLEEFGERILNSPTLRGRDPRRLRGSGAGRPAADRRDPVQRLRGDRLQPARQQRSQDRAIAGAAEVPMVVRMPWGGLRHAGPYHSQNTEPWFYRTPGLKIVAPSTPHDARALMAAAVADPDPVLFYEHIGLYRARRSGRRWATSRLRRSRWGAPRCAEMARTWRSSRTAPTSTVALGVAARLAADGIEAAVLDLRSLAPLDREAVLNLARRCGKVLIVHEDSRTGGIGESLAATIQESAFEELDAPVRIVGALDTPVPYSPPLEDAFLPSDEELERAARLLAAY